MKCSVAISYHTESDAACADALTRELEGAGVSAKKLDYLTLAGFSLPDGPAGDRLRLDGWIEHFAEILERCVGMIVIRSASGRTSETTVGRGMWIEQRLTGQLQTAPKDFATIVDAPRPGTDLVGLWAAEHVKSLTPWLNARKQSGPLGLARHRSQDAIAAQPYTNHEIQYATWERTWFFISILDLYDRVWHCKRCLASSDVWLASESRPPDRCPACEYEGQL